MASKIDIYTRVGKEIAAVIDGETSVTARFATAACLLNEAFDSYFWTGFYMVDPQKEKELVVGPYQGTLGCLRIPFGKGVCGTAAERLETIVVDDVHKFPGHIACDSRSNSEIVVPVLDKDGKLAAVLDVDSIEFASFDDDDKAGLEAICSSLLLGNKT
jgi:GAF domain-containing protein